MGSVLRFDEERFQSLLSEMRSRTSGVMASKRAEYSAGADRFENFRQVAAMTGATPAQIAYVYLLKHIQAIGQAVMGKAEFSWDWQKPDGSEGFKQRFADAHNYLDLLAGIIDEEAATHGEA